MRALRRAFLGVAVLAGCARPGPPPAGLEPARIAQGPVAPKGCKGAYVVSARTELCKEPCALNTALYRGDGRPAGPGRSCSFSQDSDAIWASWVFSGVDEGDWVCMADGGLWQLLRVQGEVASQEVHASFGRGSLAVDLELYPPTRWSRDCTPEPEATMFEEPEQD